MFSELQSRREEAVRKPPGCRQDVQCSCPHPHGLPPNRTQGQSQLALAMGRPAFISPAGTAPVMPFAAAQVHPGGDIFTHAAARTAPATAGRCPRSQTPAPGGSRTTSRLSAQLLLQSAVSGVHGPVCLVLGALVLHPFSDPLSRTL